MDLYKDRSGLAIRGTSRTMKDSSSAPQRVLVITQAALSVVLLCAAGLLLRSLNNLRTQDFGFHTRTDTLWASILSSLDINQSRPMTCIANCTKA